GPAPFLRRRRRRGERGRGHRPQPPPHGADVEPWYAGAKESTSPRVAPTNSLTPDPTAFTLDPVPPRRRSHVLDALEFAHPLGTDAPTRRVSGRHRVRQRVVARRPGGRHLRLAERRGARPRCRVVLRLRRPDRGRVD